MTALLLLLLAGTPPDRWTAVPYEPNLPNRVAPPCKGATVFDGFCWIPLVKGPPCPEKSVEHDGRCFYPLVRKKAPPAA